MVNLEGATERAQTGYGQDSDSMCENPWDILFKKNVGWAYGPVVECLPSMCETLGSILSATYK